MIETPHVFTRSEGRLVERIVEDEHVGINHIVLEPGGAMPEHRANSNVHLIVIAGGIALSLEEQEERGYPAGSIVGIPYRTLMRIRNPESGPAEFFVVKAPSPKSMERVQQGGGR